MAFVINDRVKETSDTTGTGTLNLAGATTGFETFVAGIGTGNTTYYAITLAGTAEFEVGIGTVTDASPDTLSRDTILSSSNSDSAVNFSAGTKTIFCTIPASKSVLLSDVGATTLNLSSANIHAGRYGSSSSPVNISVTVASKSAHPYQGDGSSAAYYLNGIEAPALTFHGADNVTSDSGYYYRFDQADSSNSSHPLRFYLDADKTTAFTTGVTTNGTPGSSGAYTQIDVDEDTPSILYYQCSSHAYMGNHAVVIGSNKINHSEALISFPTATTTLIGTDTTDTLTNKTLTTPTLTTPIANAGVQLKNGATSAGFLEFFEDSDNGTNKVTLIGPASTGDVTLTLPSATDTLVGKATTDTLTNKSIDSDNNTITNIVNADIQSSAAIADTKLDTISTANKISLTALDIDGATDIGEAVADADLFIIDNGAGGTNRKVTASALKTYAGGSSASKGFAVAMAIAL